MLRRLDGVPDDPLTATLHIDGQLALVDDMLHYFDRASMAHSLEVRVPFLDHELVELCATVPGDLKVTAADHEAHPQAGGAGRRSRTVRSASGRSASSAARSAAGSRRRPSARSREYLLRPDARSAEIIDQGALRRLVERQAVRAETPERHLLLAILMLEIWLSTYLPRARSRAGRAGRSGDARMVTGRGLSYAVVTPVRNEAENLVRLAESLRGAGGTARGLGDRRDGLDDGTVGTAAGLAGEHGWISVLARSRRPTPAAARSCARSRPASQLFATPPR